MPNALGGRPPFGVAFRSDMYIYIYICMYVCMYIYIYIYIYVRTYEDPSVEPANTRSRVYLATSEGCLRISMALDVHYTHMMSPRESHRRRVSGTTGLFLDFSSDLA